MSGRQQPLAGLRVLDIASFIAAPFAGATLSDFGAEVIKIELPGEGDSLRRLGTPSPAGDTFNWLNDSRNKRTLTLDLRKPAGAALFKRLVRTADVVLENFRPGTLEKWGLGWDVLHAENPRLILLRISAYGQDGPKRGLPGFARIAQAFCGLTYLTREPGGKPLVSGSPTLADYLTGLYGAFGVLLAIQERHQSGEGQVIDIGLYEGMLRFLDEMASVYAATGLVRESMGADIYSAVPHSHYPTADGKWVALACTNDRMWQRLCAVIGQPELGTHPDYATVADRVAHRDAINTLVSDWSGARPQAQVLAECEAGEVPCGPVNSIADILADAQVQARGNLLRVQDERAGEVVVPAPVPKLSATPGKLRHLGRALGADNAAIYGEELGLSAEELEALKAEGVI